MNTKSTESLVSSVNEIRKIDPTRMSYKTKEFLVNALKQEAGYEKDETKKQEARNKHSDKRDILAKLESQGLDQALIEGVKQSLYPEYKDFTQVQSQKATESSEQLSEGASEKMKRMMKVMYDEMRPDNKPYPGDLEKLQAWKGLDYREEAGVKIIDVPGVGEICSTIKSGTKYKDMDDKNGKRSLENLKHSNKFIEFASTIKGCEMMEFSDTYKLMNAVADQLGITDTIDENYINTVFKQYKHKKLPLEHPFGRVLRALYMMTGELLFVIPISVKGKVVRSVFCIYDNAGFYGLNDDFNVRPFAKIRGSL